MYFAFKRDCCRHRLQRDFYDDRLWNTKYLQKQRYTQAVHTRSQRKYMQQPYDVDYERLQYVGSKRHWEQLTEKERADVDAKIAAKKEVKQPKSVEKLLSNGESDERVTRVSEKRQRLFSKGNNGLLKGILGKRRLAAIEQLRDQSL